MHINQIGIIRNMKLLKERCCPVLHHIAFINNNLYL